MRGKTGLRVAWGLRKGFRYLTMGYGYSSEAVSLERGDGPGPGTTALDGRPGTRVPHLWLERDGERVSSLDLIGTDFTLLAGAQASWASALPGAVMMPLAWSRAAGISSTGALLVRPDGIVAWRTREAPDDGAAAVRRMRHALLNAASYVLSAKASSTSSGASASRTVSYGRVNSCSCVE